MRLIRSIGAVGIVGAAIVVFATQRPADDEALAEADTHAGDVRAALAAADANEASASSAPQQQVVNGWVARDLLEIQAQQLDAIATQLEALSEPPATDDRVPLLLLIGIVAVCFALVITRDIDTRVRAAPAPAVPPLEPQTPPGTPSAPPSRNPDPGGPPGQRF